MPTGERGMRCVHGPLSQFAHILSSRFGFKVMSVRETAWFYLVGAITAAALLWPPSEAGLSGQVAVSQAPPAGESGYLAKPELRFAAARERWEEGEILGAELDECDMQVVRVIPHQIVTETPLIITERGRSSRGESVARPPTTSIRVTVSYEGSGDAGTPGRCDSGSSGAQDEAPSGCVVGDDQVEPRFQVRGDFSMIIADETRRHSASD